MAPPADRVPHLMSDLFRWLATTDTHPLIAGSVFHCEFEFIHPFADGNGRMGRLWQSLILAHWNIVSPRRVVVGVHWAESCRSFLTNNGVKGRRCPVAGPERYRKLIIFECASGYQAVDSRHALALPRQARRQQLPGVHTAVSTNRSV